MIVHDAPVPAHAERVDFGLVFSHRPRKSRYLPGVQASVPVATCPACGWVHPDFPAHRTLTCDCGLSMKFDGGWARIWRDEPAAAEA